MSAFKDTAPLAYQVHAIRKRVAGNLADKKRTYQLVWAGSFDVDDRRAMPGKPFGDGTPEGGRCFIAQRMLAIREWNREIRLPGKPPVLSEKCLNTYEALLGMADFKTGENAVSKPRLAGELGYPLRTVERHIDRLADAGIIDWVNRTVKTGNDGFRGPQVRQTSNSYFAPETLPELLRRKLDELKALGDATWAGIKQIGKSLKAAARARGDAAVAAAQERYAKRLAKLSSAQCERLMPDNALWPAKRDSDRRESAYDRDPATIAMRLRMEALFGVT